MRAPSPTSIAFVSTPPVPVPPAQRARRAPCSGRSLKAFLVLAALAAGCAGDGTTSGGGGGGGGGDFATVQRQVFDLHCISSSCHASATRAGGLSLDPTNSYDQLVGVLAENPVANADGVLRVDPGDPDASFLIQKLMGDLEPGEGSPMPLGMAELSASEIQLVRDWIAGGALPRDDVAQ